MIFLFENMQRRFLDSLYYLGAGRFSGCYRCKWYTGPCRRGYGAVSGIWGHVEEVYGLFGGIKCHWGYWDYAAWV